jgi:hypothetical protein
MSVEANASAALLACWLGPVSAGLSHIHNLTLGAGKWKPVAETEEIKMNKIAVIVGLVALAPTLGGCFSYTHQTTPTPTTTTVVQQPATSTTATTTTTTTTPQ